MANFQRCYLAATESAALEKAFALLVTLYLPLACPLEALQWTV